MTRDEETVELLRSQSSYIGHGKTRELVGLVDPHLMLNYATDRWSACDFQFSFPIPEKGRVANVTTIATKLELKKLGHITDLVAYGAGIDVYLPPALRGNACIRERACVVRRFAPIHSGEPDRMIEFEIITRGSALGSLATAIERGEKTFCGNPIPEGLFRGAELPVPMATPTTKAKVGHDLDVTLEVVEEKYPGLLHEGVKIFRDLSNVIARARVGRLLDFKIECALISGFETPQYVLCDEISPDSVRLCRASDYSRLVIGESVDFQDKEYGRQHMAALGIKDLDPENPDDVARVLTWKGEPDFVRTMSERYETACAMLTGGFKSAEYCWDVLCV